MSTTNPVEDFFKSLVDPVTNCEPNAPYSIYRLIDAMTVFTKQPLSDDPDHKFLLRHAKENFGTAEVNACYFLQQVANLAVQKPANRKDKSRKAYQLKFFRWLALGMKKETFPFPTGVPEGLPSTTKISALVCTTSCAACGKSGANMRCPVCTFQDEEHVLNKTAYCNKKCAADHAVAHKRVCDNRIALYRAIKLFDHILIAVEEASYVYPIRHVQEKGGILYLMDDTWDRAAMTGRPIFTPLPKDQIFEKYRRAVLLWGKSKEITNTLIQLIRYIFNPICIRMEVVDSQPRNVIRPLCQVSAGRSLNAALYQRHRSLKLTLASGEEYAVDPMAAQFGWRETLAPWAAWSSLRTSSRSVEALRPASLAEAAARTSLVSDCPLELAQQDYRAEMIDSIIVELEVFMALSSYGSPQPPPSPPPPPGSQRQNMMWMYPGCVGAFGKALKAHPDEYRHIKDEVMTIIDYATCISRLSTRRNTFRLWMGPAPQFDVYIAKKNVKALKKIWFTRTEYDRLKISGQDMKKLWHKRMTGKVDMEAD
ncbi:putative set domain-containing protein 5 protein [Rosellinia necatrix]|uniref:Putative set domain-containing protein 5 protein n=1 Tax=Rosellinia necatrix TaxID=77044 RepID=A0A1S7ULW7_ROSNE|nr:putative set domain-containing protein 5 protein [Rosellinia necatrix]